MNPFFLFPPGLNSRVVNSMENKVRTPSLNSSISHLYFICNINLERGHYLASLFSVPITRYLNKMSYQWYIMMVKSVVKY